MAAKASAKASGRKAERLRKLLALCEELPEVDVSGERHRAFRIRKKAFAYYLDDHHGDGIVSICCKASFDEQSELVESDPEIFYVPAYVGAQGWVALRLDRRSVDWDLVRQLLRSAYRRQAPRRLADRVEP